MDFDYLKKKPVTAAVAQTAEEIARKKEEVLHQWRDLFGRFVDMFHNVKFKHRDKNGNVHSSIGRFISTDPKLPGFGQIYVENDPELGTGIVDISSKNASEVLASIHPDYLTQRGIKLGHDINGNPTERADADIPNVADMQVRPASEQELSAIRAHEAGKLTEAENIAGVPEEQKAAAAATTLKEEVSGDEAMASIRDAGAAYAKSQGRFPMVRGESDILGALKQQYESLFDGIKKDKPELLQNLLYMKAQPDGTSKMARSVESPDDLWDYIQNVRVSAGTRYTDIARIEPLAKELNKRYAEKYLGVKQGGLISFYRNGIHAKENQADSAAGYVSLDRYMAWNYGVTAPHTGDNTGRFIVKVKPEEINGIIGVSGIHDEYGAVISPEVTSMPGRVVRVGDVEPYKVPHAPWMNFEAPVNEAIQSDNQRFLGAVSQFDYYALDKDPFGGADTWDGFTSANNLKPDALKSKYDELYGEGAWDKDWAAQEPTSKVFSNFFQKFTGEDGKDHWGLKADEFYRFPGGSSYDKEPKAGDTFDKNMKVLSTMQELIGKPFMVSKGHDLADTRLDTPNVAKPIEEAVPSANLMEETPEVPEEVKKAVDGFKNEVGTRLEKFKRDIAGGADIGAAYAELTNGIYSLRRETEKSFDGSEHRDTAKGLFKNEYDEVVREAGNIKVAAEKGNLPEITEEAKPEEVTPEGVTPSVAPGSIPQPIKKLDALEVLGLREGDLFYIYGDEFNSLPVQYIAGKDKQYYRVNDKELLYSGKPGKLETLARIDMRENGTAVYKGMPPRETLNNGGGVAPKYKHNALIEKQNGKGYIPTAEDSAPIEYLDPKKLRKLVAGDRLYAYVTTSSASPKRVARQFEVGDDGYIYQVRTGKFENVNIGSLDEYADRIKNGDTSMQFFKGDIRRDDLGFPISHSDHSIKFQEQKNAEEEAKKAKNVIKTPEEPKLEEEGNKEEGEEAVENGEEVSTEATKEKVAKPKHIYKAKPGEHLYDNDGKYLGKVLEVKSEDPDEEGQIPYEVHLEQPDGSVEVREGYYTKGVLLPEDTVTPGKAKESTKPAEEAAPLDESKRVKKRFVQELTQGEVVMNPNDPTKEAGIVIGWRPFIKDGVKGDIIHLQKEDGTTSSVFVPKTKSLNYAMTQDKKGTNVPVNRKKEITKENLAKLTKYDFTKKINDKARLPGDVNPDHNQPEEVKPVVPAVSTPKPVTYDHIDLKKSGPEKLNRWVWNGSLVHDSFKNRWDIFKKADAKYYGHLWGSQTGKRGRLEFHGDDDYVKSTEIHGDLNDPKTIEKAKKWLAEQEAIYNDPAKREATRKATADGHILKDGDVVYAVDPMTGSITEWTLGQKTEPDVNGISRDIDVSKDSWGEYAVGPYTDRTSLTSSYINKDLAEKRSQEIKKEIAEANGEPAVSEPKNEEVKPEVTKEPTVEPEKEEEEEAAPGVTENKTLLREGDSKAPTSFSPENALQDIEAAKYDMNDLDEKGNPKRSTYLNKIVKIGGRVQVVANINGVNIPFYISTGSGNKKTVATGKWYPYFGVGSDSWMNKGTEEEINNYYGSPELRKMAEWLDANYGDLREDKSIPVADSKTNGENEIMNLIEKHMGPGIENKPTSDSRDRIADIVRKIRMEPEATKPEEKEEEESNLSEEEKQANRDAWTEVGHLYRKYVAAANGKNRKREAKALLEELKPYPVVAAHVNLAKYEKELMDKLDSTEDEDTKTSIRKRLQDIRAAKKELQLLTNDGINKGHNKPTDPLKDDYRHLLEDISEKAKEEAEEEEPEIENEEGEETEAAKPEEESTPVTAEEIYFKPGSPFQFVKRPKPAVLASVDKKEILKNVERHADGSISYNADGSKPGVGFIIQPIKDENGNLKHTSVRLVWKTWDSKITGDVYGPYDPSGIPEHDDPEWWVDHTAKNVVNRNKEYNANQLPGQYMPNFIKTGTKNSDLIFGVDPKTLKSTDLSDPRKFKLTEGHEYGAQMWARRGNWRAIIFDKNGNVGWSKELPYGEGSDSDRVQAEIRKAVEEKMTELYARKNGTKTGPEKPAVKEEEAATANSEHIDDSFVDLQDVAADWEKDKYGHIALGWNMAKPRNGSGNMAVPKKGAEFWGEIRYSGDHKYPRDHIRVKFQDKNGYWREKDFYGYYNDPELLAKGKQWLAQQYQIWKDPARRDATEGITADGHKPKRGETLYIVDHYNRKVEKVTLDSGLEGDMDPDFKDLVGKYFVQQTNWGAYEVMLGKSDRSAAHIGELINAYKDEDLAKKELQRRLDIRKELKDKHGFKFFTLGEEKEEEPESKVEGFDGKHSFPLPDDMKMVRSFGPYGGVEGENYANYVIDGSDSSNDPDAIKDGLRFGAQIHYEPAAPDIKRPGQWRIHLNDRNWGEDLSRHNPIEDRNTAIPADFNDPEGWNKAVAKAREMIDKAVAARGGKNTPLKSDYIPLESLDQIRPNDNLIYRPFFPVRPSDRAYAAARPQFIGKVVAITRDKDGNRIFTVQQIAAGDSKPYNTDYTEEEFLNRFDPLNGGVARYDDETPKGQGLPTDPTKKLANEHEFKVPKDMNKLVDGVSNDAVYAINADQTTDIFNVPGVKLQDGVRYGAVARYVPEKKRWEVRLLDKNQYTDGLRGIEPKDDAEKFAAIDGDINDPKAWEKAVKAARNLVDKAVAKNGGDNTPYVYDLREIKSLSDIKVGDHLISSNEYPLHVDNKGTEHEKSHLPRFMGKVVAIEKDKNGKPVLKIENGYRGEKQISKDDLKYIAAAVRFSDEDSKVTGKSEESKPVAPEAWVEKMDNLEDMVRKLVGNDPKLSKDFDMDSFIESIRKKVIKSGLLQNADFLNALMYRFKQRSNRQNDNINRPSDHLTEKEVHDIVDEAIKNNEENASREPLESRVKLYSPDEIRNLKPHDFFYLFYNGKGPARICEVKDNGTYFSGFDSKGRPSYDKGRPPKLEELASAIENGSGDIVYSTRDKNDKRVSREEINSLHSDSSKTKNKNGKHLTADGEEFNPGDELHVIAYDGNGNPYLKTIKFGITNKPRFDPKNDEYFDYFSGYGIEEAKDGNVYITKAGGSERYPIEEVYKNKIQAQIAVSRKLKELEKPEPSGEGKKKFSVEKEPIVDAKGRNRIRVTVKDENGNVVGSPSDFLADREDQIEAHIEEVLNNNNAWADGYEHLKEESGNREEGQGNGEAPSPAPGNKNKNKRPVGRAEEDENVIRERLFELNPNKKIEIPDDVRNEFGHTVVKYNINKDLELGDLPGGGGYYYRVTDKKTGELRYVGVFIDSDGNRVKNWFTGNITEDPGNMAKEWVVAKIVAHNKIYNKKNEKEIEKEEKKPKPKPKPKKVDRDEIDKKIAIQNAIDAQDPDNYRMASERNVPRGYLKIDEQPRWLQKLAKKSADKEDFIKKFYEAIARTEPVTESHKKWAGFMYDYLMGKDEGKTVYIHSGTGNVVRFDEETVSYKYLNDLNQYMNMEALVSGKEDAVRIIDIVPDGTKAFGHTIGHRINENGDLVKISGLVSETENGIHMVLLNSLHKSWAQDTRVGHEDNILPDLARVFFHESGHAYARERLAQELGEGSPAYKEYLDNFYKDGKLKGLVSKLFDRDGAEGKEAFAELYYDHIMSLYGDTSPVSDKFAGFLMKHSSNEASFSPRPDIMDGGNLMSETLNPGSEEIDRHNASEDVLNDFQANLVDMSVPRYFQNSYHYSNNIRAKLKMIAADRIAVRMNSNPVSALVAAGINDFKYARSSNYSDLLGNPAPIVSTYDIRDIIDNTHRGELTLDTPVFRADFDGLEVDKLGNLFPNIPKNATSEEIQKYLDDAESGRKSYREVLGSEIMNHWRYFSDSSYQGRILYSDTEDANDNFMRLEAAKSLIAKWASTSNDNDIVSLSLQQAVKDHFNLENANSWNPTPTKSWLKNGDVSPESVNLYLQMHRPALEDFISSQYKSTQDFLTKANIKELVVYRGTSMKSEEIEGSKLPENDVFGAKLTQRPMSSWATSMQIASRFSGDVPGQSAVIKSVVKKEDILGVAGVGVGCHEENEAVILHKDGREAVAVVINKLKINKEYHFTSGNRDDLEEYISDAQPLFAKPTYVKELNRSDFVAEGEFELGGKKFTYKAKYLENDFSEDRIFNASFASAGSPLESSTHIEIMDPSRSSGDPILTFKVDTANRDLIERHMDDHDINLEIHGGPLEIYREGAIAEWPFYRQNYPELEDSVKKSFIKQMIHDLQLKNPEIFVPKTIRYESNNGPDLSYAMDGLADYRFPDLSDDSSGLENKSNLMEENLGKAKPEISLDSDDLNADWIKTGGWDLPTDPKELANLFEDSDHLEHFKTLPAAKAAPRGLLDQAAKEIEDRKNPKEASVESPKLVMPEPEEGRGKKTVEAQTLFKEIKSLKEMIANGEDLQNYLKSRGKEEDPEMAKLLNRQRRELRGLEFVEAYRKQTGKDRVSAPYSVFEGNHPMFNDTEESKPAEITNNFLLGTEDPASGKPDRLYTSGTFSTDDGTVWQGMGHYTNPDKVSDRDATEPLVGKFKFVAMGADRKPRVITVSVNKYNAEEYPDDGLFYGPAYMSVVDTSDVKDENLENQFKKVVAEQLARHPYNIKVANSMRDVKLPGNVESYFSKIEKFQTMAKDNGASPSELDHLEELKARSGDALGSYLVASTGENFNFKDKALMHSYLTDNAVNEVARLASFQKYLSSKYNLHALRGHDDTAFTAEEVHLSPENMSFIDHARPEDELGIAQEAMISKERRAKALNNMLEAIKSTSRPIVDLNPNWTPVESEARKELTPEIEKALTDWYAGDENEHKKQLDDYMNGNPDAYPHIKYYMKHMQSRNPITGSRATKNFRLPGDDVYKHKSGITLIVPKMVASETWAQSKNPLVTRTTDDEGVRRHADILDHIYSKNGIPPSRRLNITIGSTKLESKPEYKSMVDGAFAICSSPDIRTFYDKISILEMAEDQNITGWTKSDYDKLDKIFGTLGIILAHEVGHPLHQDKIVDLYKPEDRKKVEELMAKHPLSEYAKGTPEEYLAEAWASYVMSKNGRGVQPEVTDYLLSKVEERREAIQRIRDAEAEQKARLGIQ